MSTPPRRKKGKKGFVSDKQRMAVMAMLREAYGVPKGSRDIILFHRTGKKNADAIRKQGFKPGPGLREDPEESSIYFTPRRDLASVHDDEIFESKGFDFVEDIDTNDPSVRATVEEFMEMFNEDLEAEGSKKRYKMNNKKDFMEVLEEVFEGDPEGFAEDAILPQTLAVRVPPWDIVKSRRRIAKEKKRVEGKDYEPYYAPPSQRYLAEVTVDKVGKNQILKYPKAGSVREKKLFAAVAMMKARDDLRDARAIRHVNWKSKKADYEKAKKEFLKLQGKPKKKKR